MFSLYRTFYILVRIYIFAKIFYLLVVTIYYPETYPISLLTWWIYFLIFDIWLDYKLPNKTNTPNEPNESELRQ
jgi:hypothetical protein